MPPRKTPASRPDGAPPPGTAPDQAGERKTGTVQSVEITLSILDGIAQNNGLVRVNELARQLGITKARVSRHLQTLLGLGLVARGPQEGYTFGWKLLQLGRAALQDNTLVEIARPHLLRLRDEINQTVVLSVPSTQGSVVVACVESLDITPVTVRIASLLAPPLSPAGRLTQAYSPTAGKRKANALRHWPEFHAEYEIDTGRGFGGLAVPVLDAHNSLVAAVSIVAPASALQPHPCAAMVQALNECVAAIRERYLG